MYITPFRVRLAEPQDPTKIRAGMIGTVVGFKQVQTPNGVQDLQAVIWTNVDEETGEETPGNQPTPSFHNAHELRGHASPPHWDFIEDDSLEEGEEDTSEELNTSSMDTPTNVTEVGTAQNPSPGVQATQ